ncbi:RES domain-containing protein [Humitalea rosea]|uniref:RES domain-containing protein n=1 Tax=Humitalea rosea TaxID=990373 RepID=A0A2W7IJY8_9PROT|nr:RES family NAD+ phosphorylase [Humitalea rosea]PZW47107.1 RES domain-containing protein [Humitalea rosea]
MIGAWRLCRAPYADLTGAGALAWGGRWNSPGRAVVYAADHPALAVLEVRVHLDLPPELIPADYVLLRLSLPKAETIPSLPEDPRALGDAWLAEGRSPVLRVPSVIVPGAWTLLLNPRHPQAAEAAILEQVPFSFDRRLWAG